MCRRWYTWGNSAALPPEDRSLEPPMHVSKLCLLQDFSLMLLHVSKYSAVLQAWQQDTAARLHVCVWHVYVLNSFAWNSTCGPPACISASEQPAPVMFWLQAVISGTAAIMHDCLWHSIPALHWKTYNLLTCVSAGKQQRAAAAPPAGLLAHPCTPAAQPQGCSGGFQPASAPLSSCLLCHPSSCHTYSITESCTQVY